MDFKVFVEISLGSKVKYEVDEETGELTVDRFLHGANYFPFNYGYVKGSLGEDNDPLDVVLLSSQPILPGMIVKCHTVGYLEMKDEGGIDTKIVAVPDKKIDPVYGPYKDITDVSSAEKAMVKDFFDVYKNLEEGKWVKTGDFKGAKSAEKEIEKAIKRHSSK